MLKTIMYIQELNKRARKLKSQNKNEAKFNHTF